MQLYTGPDCYPIGLDRGQAQRMAVDLFRVALPSTTLHSDQFEECAHFYLPGSSLITCKFQIRECFSAADDAGVGAGYEHFGWARLCVVLRGHAVAVCASSANGKQIAALQCGQAALARQMDGSMDLVAGNARSGVSCLQRLSATFCYFARSTSVPTEAADSLT